jgi:hypothetical protein
MANALFGKFEQKNNKSQTLFLNNSLILKIFIFRRIKLRIYFVLTKKYAKFKIIPNNLKLPPNRKTNCYLGAQITAFARQVIYEHLQTLISSNATIYQIDCDSIIFTLPRKSTYYL